MSDNLIVSVIQRYYSDWKPPKDTGKDWISVHCPFHGDSTKSASVSYTRNKFRCFSCPVRGDAIDIIMRQEEVPFAEAKRISETVSPGSYREIPPEPSRESGRRVFGESRTRIPQRTKGGRRVPTRVRRDPPPWSRDV